MSVATSACGTGSRASMVLRKRSRYAHGASLPSRDAGGTSWKASLRKVFGSYRMGKGYHAGMVRLWKSCHKNNTSGTSSDCPTIRSRASRGTSSTTLVAATIWSAGSEFTIGRTGPMQAIRIVFTRKPNRMTQARRPRVAVLLLFDGRTMYPAGVTRPPMPHRALLSNRRRDPQFRISRPDRSSWTDRRSRMSSKRFLAPVCSIPSTSVSTHTASLRALCR